MYSNKLSVNYGNRKKQVKLICLLVVILPLLVMANDQPRLLVLTDIGGDPDDMQSMRRLMLYSNEFRITGLIASAAGTPGELKQEITHPEFIRDIVQDYAAVQKNLSLHAHGYPPGADLEKVIKRGSSKRGIPYILAEYSTEGSEHIIHAVDASDEPLYVVIWGGAHDLAQALFDVSRKRSHKEAAFFVSKLRVYAISDQDSWQSKNMGGTGAWIRSHFPSLRYVEPGSPSIERFTSLFRGMYQNDSKGGRHPVIQLVRDEVVPMNQEAWVEKNVRKKHGPLGAGYPITGQNPHSSRNTRGIKEGDTPSWFFILPNGLSDPEQPTWGGWGGRFQLDKGGHFIDAEDEHWSGNNDAALRRKWTVARWRKAYQNDFQVRMDWCVKIYANANHHPVVFLNGDRGRDVVKMTVPSGQIVYLSAMESSDPDGDTLSFKISNRPRWAGFDASTGRLNGTPAEGDVGAYNNIVISVTDGTDTVSLSAFSIEVKANVVATGLR